MYERINPEPYAGPEPSNTTQGLAIIAIILAILLTIWFAPPRDPSKVVPGISCSVVSETQISAVMGTDMQLLPTSGSLCRYVATNSDVERSVIVVAHRVESPRPHNAFTVEVIEPISQGQSAQTERRRLVALIPRAGTIAVR